MTICIRRDLPRSVVEAPERLREDPDGPLGADTS